MKIGWIGTGVMGVSMCGHLGNDVIIYTRTKPKAQPLLDRGATWTDSPRQVARQADIIFTMVGSPADVRQVYFGETGIVAGLTPGKITVDLTTTAPSLAQEIFHANPRALDAPTAARARAESASARRNASSLKGTVTFAPRKPSMRIRRTVAAKPCSGESTRP